MFNGSSSGSSASTVLNLCILFFLGILVWAYFGGSAKVSTGLFREGMDVSGNGGMGGGVTQFLATLQAKVIQYQDQFLISKYRTDYENVIIKMSDLADSLMLEAMLTADLKNPMAAFTKINTLNGAKGGLNAVMKFVDGAK